MFITFLDTYDVAETVPEVEDDVVLLEVEEDMDAPIAKSPVSAKTFVTFLLKKKKLISRLSKSKRALLTQCQQTEERIHPCYNW